MFIILRQQRPPYSKAQNAKVVQEDKNKASMTLKQKMTDKKLYEQNISNTLKEYLNTCYKGISIYRCVFIPLSPNIIWKIHTEAMLYLRWPSYGIWSVHFCCGLLVHISQYSFIKVLVGQATIIFKIYFDFHFTKINETYLHVKISNYLKLTKVIFNYTQTSLEENNQRYQYIIAHLKNVFQG